MDNTRFWSNGQYTQNSGPVTELESNGRPRMYNAGITRLTPSVTQYQTNPRPRNNNNNSYNAAGTLSNGLNAMNPQLNFQNNNLQNVNGQNQFTGGNNIQIANPRQASNPRQAAFIQVSGVIYFSLLHRVLVFIIFPITG